MCLKSGVKTFYLGKQTWPQELEINERRLREGDVVINTHTESFKRIGEVLVTMYIILFFLFPFHLFYVITFLLQPADPFELRLVGGDNPCAGRLEVLHKGTWGSVCDDSWGEEEDQVVCKQLGCGKSLSPSSKAGKSYRPGAGRIWLDDVVCSGKEKSLESCQHRLWGYHDCTHKEDVEVMCSGKSYCHTKVHSSGQGNSTRAAEPQ